MIKTIRAFISGYLFFDVNGKRFYNYTKAQKYRKSIEGSVCFKGWNIFYLFSKHGAWRAFYIRLINPKLEPCPED